MSFSKMFKEIISEHDKENDGIGPYEYWGEKCNDKQPDYIRGSVIIAFSEPYSKEKVNELIDELDSNGEFEDEVNDIISDRFFGDDPETSEKSFIEYDGRIAIQVDYTSSVPEPEYDEYEDTE